MERYGAQRLLNTLVEQLANRTGIFTRTVQPTNLPDAPGGGGIFGWGVSVGGGFEKSTSTTDLVYEVDLNLTEEREFTYGMTFPSSSTDLKPYIKNLTDTNRPFPTGEDYKKIAGQNAKCMTENLVALKALFDKGLLPESVYLDLVKDAVAKGCHVKYEAPDSPSMKAMFAQPMINPKAPEGLTPQHLQLELKLLRHSRMRAIEHEKMVDPAPKKKSTAEKLTPPDSAPTFVEEILPVCVDRPTRCPRLRAIFRRR